MKLFLALLFSFLLFFGCGEGDFKGFTNGQLTTISGAPVANAEIHILYPDLQNRYPKAKPTASINFSLPQSGRVSLDTYRFGTSILIENVVSEELNPGTYSFTISDSLYTNGVYKYTLKAPRVDLSKKMLLLRKESDLLENIIPLATTNISDDFSIQTSVFGIGEIFSSERSSSSLTVPSKIVFIAIKNGEVIARKTVRISNGIDNEVSMIANK